jgi:hypothetical protein
MNVVFRRILKSSPKSHSYNFGKTIHIHTGIRRTLIMANRAAFLESEKGKFVVRDAEIGQPGEGEVLVKVGRFTNVNTRDLQYLKIG